ncbi:MAG: hypothetical protein ACO1RT_19925 [Planctomycetaceae bacterium]
MNKQSVASFVVSGWHLDVTCQRDSVRFAVTHDASSESMGTISLLNDPLPALAEVFIRGDELHLSMPQTDATQSGLALALLVVQADRDCLVVESTLSIETLLLDAYPTVELGLSGDGPITCRTEGSANVFTRELNQSDANDRPKLNVLVDQRDHDSLCHRDDPDQSLRFFGEFMEKGVIRKTQPWWVWTSAAADAAQVKRLVAQLAQRPLPLTN